MTLLSIRNLKKHYKIKRGFMSKEMIVRAVDGVSFDIDAEHTLGLAGESGCGKTTVARLILKLIEPTAGEIQLKGFGDISQLPKEKLKEFRRHSSIIFQDPSASLNPRKTVRHILRRPLQIHTPLKKEDIEERIKMTLHMVGLTPPETFIDRHPHELSGGQKQRIGIAKAVILNPRLVVADEPVSSLDVSVRAQILILMRRLQKEMGLTYLFITHDLGVLRSISNKVAIMYVGRIVEIGPVRKIFQDPLHPYTRALLLATPIPDPRARARAVLEGEVVSPSEEISGCRFRTRCPYAAAKCDFREPELVEVDREHAVACHLKT